MLTRFSPNPEQAVGQLCVGFVSKYSVSRLKTHPHISKCVEYDPNKVYPFKLADGSSWVFVATWGVLANDSNSTFESTNSLPAFGGAAWNGLCPSLPDRTGPGPGAQQSWLPQVPANAVQFLAPINWSSSR